MTLVDLGVRAGDTRGDTRSDSRRAADEQVRMPAVEVRAFLEELGPRTLAVF